MTWFGWLLSADMALSTLLFRVAIVGLHRKPVTAREATIQVLVTTLYIIGMATIGTVH